jgi:hypothetical protein
MIDTRYRTLGRRGNGIQEVQGKSATLLRNCFVAGGISIDKVVEFCCSYRGSELQFLAQGPLCDSKGLQTVA